MFRQLVLWAALAPGALAAGRPAVVAGPKSEPQFQVFVRTDSGRQLHGTYRHHAEARRIAMELWRAGHRVEIWEVKSVR